LETPKKRRHQFSASGCAKRTIAVVPSTGFTDLIPSSPDTAKSTDFLPRDKRLDIGVEPPLFRRTSFYIPAIRIFFDFVDRFALRDLFADALQKES